MFLSLEAKTPHWHTNLSLNLINQVAAKYTIHITYQPKQCTDFSLIMLSIQTCISKAKLKQNGVYDFKT